MPTEVSSDLVKELRERTEAGMMDCRKALQETGGDLEKAIRFLREKGLASAQKKSGRVAAQGSIESYIHMNGSIGVLVEINCESDFVAKTDQFKQLLKDVAMHIAAARPQYVRREDVPENVIAAEKEIMKAQMQQEESNKKKDPAILEKIVTGKLEKFYKDICLEEQAYVKDPDKTIKDLVAETVGKLGENIRINRFVRLQRGEK